MSAIFLALGVILAGLIIAGSLQLKSFNLRMGAIGAAVVVLGIFFTLASFRKVGEDSIGVVSKSIGFTKLASGKIIATAGEKGPQADILPPGWQPWYWPFIYDIDFTPVVEIEQGEVGMLTASDGLPLPQGATYAQAWKKDEEKKMLSDAKYFLTDGGGFKGPQTTVLTPGKYRFNPKLFKVKRSPVLTIAKTEVGVVKSNVGDAAPGGTGELEAGKSRLVDRGQRGIWREPLIPDQYYEFSHQDAYQVTKIYTQQQIIRYTSSHGKNSGDQEENEINVITSDGFDFPVDVRIQYKIKPMDAPLLVASVGDDQAGLRAVMNSNVRTIFRNNAQSVKALDYVKQRKEQGEQSLKMLQAKLSGIGVTIVQVSIGRVGDEKTLGLLLNTQKDREIALQEQETLKVQQLAAEEEKALIRTQQEAKEEIRLATARYGVQIAEQDREKLIIAAGAEAEAVKIKAEAQANAYKLIAEQIGSGNAALVEFLKIIGEEKISITPRVMVIGQGGKDGASGETTALIGTMLDSMVQATPEK